jgi:putative ABC transport system permease protein
MSYALATLWHDRQRFLPGVLAVAFSALLMVMQFGLLIGLFAITSIPIDQSHADLWVGSPEVLSVDLGQAIPQRYLCRVAAQPEVTRCERFLEGFMHWTKPSGGSELCIVIGLNLGKDSLADIHGLTPDLRMRLAEPGGIIIDDGDLARLGVYGIGDRAEITHQQVRIVGLVHGIRSLSGPYVFCSIPTARHLLRMTPDQTTYVLARCRRPEDAAIVAKRLNVYPTMSAFPSHEFSLHSRLHWLTKTKAGIALGLAAALGLMVGAVVTSQTLYAATIASLREYAVLRALGIPRWRMALTVLAQSFWVGMGGLLVAVPAILGLCRAAGAAAVPVLLPPELLLIAAAVTMTMALLSGLMALRSLRLVEPALLLR